MTILRLFWVVPILLVACDASNAEVLVALDEIGVRCIFSFEKQE